MTLKWSRRIKPGDEPKYQQEATDPKKEKIEHSQGWPHYDHKGNCLCMCKRCMGDSGCICAGCAGIGHVNCPHAELDLTAGVVHERIQV